MQIKGEGLAPMLAVSAAALEAAGRNEHSQSEWTDGQAAATACNFNTRRHAMLEFAALTANLRPLRRRLSLGLAFSLIFPRPSFSLFVPH